METTYQARLQGQMLIAMPHLEDPNFNRSLTLVCEENAQGTIGFILNRPTSLKLGSLLRQLDIYPASPELDSIPVFNGGPCQSNRGFVLHNDPHTYGGTVKVAKELYLTSSRDILVDLANQRGPDHFLFLMGYAGWCKNQLVDEILANTWLTLDCDDQLIFKTPAQDSWVSAATQLGIQQVSLLSNQAGHA